MQFLSSRPQVGITGMKNCKVNQRKGRACTGYKYDACGWWDFASVWITMLRNSNQYERLESRNLWTSFMQAGGCMELFMIKTGFYNKYASTRIIHLLPCKAALQYGNSMQKDREVYCTQEQLLRYFWGWLFLLILWPYWGMLCRVTELEAQRLDESKEEREAFRRMLREEVERQAREKHLNIKLPPDPSETAWLVPLNTAGPFLQFLRRVYWLA